VGADFLSIRDDTHGVYQDVGDLGSLKITVTTTRVIKRGRVE